MRNLNRFMDKQFSSKRASVIFLCLLFLSSCGSGKDKNKENSVSDEDKIVLSSDSVGPINSQSPFNMHKATLDFPRYNVVEELNYHLGSPYPVIRVSKGIKTLLIINPSKDQQSIFSVIIEDNLITNSLGHRIGTVYKDIYQYGQKEDCQLGQEDMASKVLCYAPKTPNILYVFEGKHSGNMPAAEVLQEWTLESIIWRPNTK